MRQVVGCGVVNVTVYQYNFAYSISSACPTPRDQFSAVLIPANSICDAIWYAVFQTFIMFVCSAHYSNRIRKGIDVFRHMGYPEETLIEIFGVGDYTGNNFDALHLGHL
jgi:hypothetical protein